MRLGVSVPPPRAPCLEAHRRAYAVFTDRPLLPLGTLWPEKVEHVGCEETESRQRSSLGSPPAPQGWALPPLVPRRKLLFAAELTSRRGWAGSLSPGGLLTVTMLLNPRSNPSVCKGHFGKGRVGAKRVRNPRRAPRASLGREAVTRGPASSHACGSPE